MTEASSAQMHARWPQLRDRLVSDGDLIERNLWWRDLLECLREAASADGSARLEPCLEGSPATVRATPDTIGEWLDALSRDPEAVHALRQRWEELWTLRDMRGLLAEAGLAQRMSFFSEFWARFALRWQGPTPYSDELRVLLGQWFQPGDVSWLAAVPESHWQRLAGLLQTSATVWRQQALDATQSLVHQIAAAGTSSLLRQRMDGEVLRSRPFFQLTSVFERVRLQLEEGPPQGHWSVAQLKDVRLLRQLLQLCREASDSVHRHLEAHGVSADLLFQSEQLVARSRRADAMLDVLLSSEPELEAVNLVSQLIEADAEQRGLRRWLQRHTQLLAQQVAERSADTGDHYITRSRGEYWQMFRKALGGGAVIGGTTMLKFLIGALSLSAFWGGFWAGSNYALSFLAVHFLHWTVATKQPAMTAPALARQLHHLEDPQQLDGFVDEVISLLRSQFIAVVGNLLAVVPVVLAAQWLWSLVAGHPFLTETKALATWSSLSVWGATPLFAAFTGVLLFASSLIGGWAENRFVFQRWEMALRYRLQGRLGQAGAERWSRFARTHVAGVAANVSLGLMLGLVPAVLQFFGLPLEVRHVTLAMGQIAAAAGSLGTDAMHAPGLWWALAGVVVTGALNVGVSFVLALHVAARSRGLALRERAALLRAVWLRLRHSPRDLFWPRG